MADRGRSRPAARAPAQNQVAFLSARSGVPAVWLMNPDGSNPRQVTAEVNAVSAYAFAPTVSRCLRHAVSSTMKPRTLHLTQRPLSTPVLAPCDYWSNHADLAQVLAAENPLSSAPPPGVSSSPGRPAVTPNGGYPPTAWSRPGDLLTPLHHPLSPLPTTTASPHHPATTPQPSSGAAWWLPSTTKNPSRSSA